MKDNLPVEILNKELPKNKFKDCNFYYDEKKRTSGGFVDAIFLSSLILTVGLWVMVIFFLGGK